jgi:D-glycero-alpha-D-manno-heptose-7-phosphate kinase
MIISRTPFRVSLFGGGTDYAGWFREHGGAVLATTIDKFCYISVRELPPFFEHRYRVVYSVVENVQDVRDIKHPAVRAVLESMESRKGLEIHHDGDLPARAGLGSSSAFTVGLLNALHALRGHYTSKEALANEAIHVEQCMLKEPVGVQDQISASFGGFNLIEIRKDGSFAVSPMILARERLSELQDHLLLYFTGISRLAPEVAQTVIDNLQVRTSELHTMRQMVDEAVSILSSPARSIVELGTLLAESWQLKRQLSHRVSNQAVDEMYDAAIQAGAIGGKLLGAGGGGFMLLFAPPEAQPRIQYALRNSIGVPFRFESAGSRIVLYQPDGL